MQSIHCSSAPKIYLYIYNNSSTRRTAIAIWMEVSISVIRQFVSNLCLIGNNKLYWFHLSWALWLARGQYKQQQHICNVFFAMIIVLLFSAEIPDRFCVFDSPWLRVSSTVAGHGLANPATHPTWTELSNDRKLRTTSAYIPVTSYISLS